ncbi:MAG: flagellar hook protein FlgE [Halothiobacillus sp. 24-54-40]|jgi:flagellar hook protein FlgE|nr:MAG: flagellar hook protein FlgE [Halothiobacillus sp. 35-54-62]OYZ87947.1 MAG: flagellar hook protein FlgE [Halothiobacillus sp. 24-54-40]OZA81434.1 MAG: flagellar hook protein FlgE [Halothiobacillus sp. 39-53-45]HQS02155.1 flagellar hook protein FlgE [Halothiobacillus sp.]HQS28965.1 flagellar hook protein FlgE [Halothiobacillus sp.]
MSFNTSITGLNAAQKDLDVTSNNIANANSTGFKSSRAQFGDIYAVSAFGNSKTATGQGVLTEAVQQQFTQGSLQFTNNSLDLAISGQGFFAFQPTLDSQESVYSRAGAMGVNKDGFIVNSTGQYLKALPVNANGTLKSTSIASAAPIQLPVAAGAPKATTKVTQSFNLPASAVAPTTAFNLAQATPDPASYNQANSQQVYDSLGNTHSLTTYYVKTANPGEWNLYYQLDTQAPIQGPSTLTFDANGQLPTAPAPFALTVPAATLGTGAADLNIAMTTQPDSTQYNAPFNMAAQSQDGNTTGQLTGISVGSNGLIQATYSNGQSVALGAVTMVNFANPQALKQVGNNSWVQTVDSGTPNVGQAGTGTFGSIQGGALEQSNVDLTTQLVNMIVAQRNFQANAQAIQTDKTATDAVMQIR